MQLKKKRDDERDELGFSYVFFIFFDGINFVANIFKIRQKYIIKVFVANPLLIVANFFLTETIFVAKPVPDSLLFCSVH